MTQREAIAQPWRDEFAQRGLTDLAMLLTDDVDQGRVAGTWELLDKPGLGERRRWRWTLDNGHDPSRVFYVKRYAATRLPEQWDRIRRQTARHSRAHWEFTQASRLNSAHISAPRAVGYVEQMRGALEHRSAVIFERANGGAFDRTWSRAVDNNLPIARGLARLDMAVRLARFIAAFHSTGFCHRDLYLCHVFVDIDAEASRPPQFSLIDLARTHRPRWRRMRWIIKDLAQLDASARQIGASRTDRLRFLRNYLNLERRAPRLRWYARRIVRKSDWILWRDARKSGRPGVNR